MEKFLQILKENPKKAILILIALLVFSIGSMFIQGCALKAGEIHIKDLNSQVGKTDGISR